MPERLFGNRYRIIERIGIGGMAEVYRATDEVLGRTVAIKLMLQQYAADPTFAARFKQEAQAAANLQSPYIVNIYDWGREDEGSTYYIVMELLRGTDLKTAIKERGFLNQRKAAEIGSQVCSALSVAHGYDIIHRDIKPHNIMIQPDGNAKVMDFGIARAKGTTMTQTGSVLGTAYYVSPEQAQGKPLTPASDLYSLGVVLYETVTGRVPFEGDDAVSVALKQVNELPLPPSAINPDIDPQLEEIILKAMAKRPEDRYVTADSMRMALNNYLAGRPVNTGIADPTAATRVIGAAAPAAAAAAGVPGGAGTGRPAGAHQLPVLEPLPKDGLAQTSVMPPTATASTINYSGYAPLNKHNEPQKPKKSRVPLVLGIIAGVLVVAFAVFVIWTLNKPAPAPEQISIPNIVGSTEQEARDTITAANLNVGVVTHSYSDSIQEGMVISSNPRAGSLVDSTTLNYVDFVVSDGPEPPAAPTTGTVPDLTNKTPADAESALGNAGFKATKAGEVASDTVDAGRVCQQDPAANTTANLGTTVSYYVSTGKATTTMPWVVGTSKTDAERILNDAGLIVKYGSDTPSDTIAEGLVATQDPASGTSVTKGQTVTLALSSGPAPVVVPKTIIGLSPDDARTALSNIGLVMDEGIEYVETTKASEVGKVMKTDPAVGQSVPPKTTVTIYIGTEPVTNPPDNTTDNTTTTTPTS